MSKPCPTCNSNMRPVGAGPCPTCGQDSDAIRSLFAAPAVGAGSTAGPATNGETAGAAPGSDGGATPKPGHCLLDVAQGTPCAIAGRCLTPSETEAKADVVRDAERYRWLRRNEKIVANGFGNGVGLKTGYWEPSDRTKRELDQAIDRELAKEASHVHR